MFRRVLGASVPALRRLDDGVGGAGVHGNGDEVLEVAIIIAAAAAGAAYDTCVGFVAHAVLVHVYQVS